MWGIRVFCLSCAEGCGAFNSRGFVLIQDGRPSFLQGLLGTFGHMQSLKMADVSVNRYLWNPFYCYSNQYID